MADQRDRWFVGEDYKAAVDVFDGVKDAFATGVPVEGGADVVTAFGLHPGVASHFANAYVGDVHAQVTEWGGSEQDVRVTCLLDGMMLGLSLFLSAQARESA